MRFKVRHATLAQPHQRRSPFSELKLVLPTGESSLLLLLCWLLRPRLGGLLAPAEPELEQVEPRFFFFLLRVSTWKKGSGSPPRPPAEALRAAPSFVAARGAVPKGVVNVGKSRVLPWPMMLFDLEVCPEKIGVYGMNLKINIRVQN